MREEDEEKTSFKTHHRHFQFRVMSFGLTNAPTTFRYLMNTIFAQHTRKSVIVFLNVILVYNMSLLDHLLHLRQVLELLCHNQLYAKESKCVFTQDHIEYLGHVIYGVAVATDVDTTQAMHTWPVPTSTIELRGFLVEVVHRLPQWQIGHAKNRPTSSSGRSEWSRKLVSSCTN
jgi:hypothetical protein